MQLLGSICLGLSQPSADACPSRPSRSSVIPRRPCTPVAAARSGTGRNGGERSFRPRGDDSRSNEHPEPQFRTSVPRTPYDERNATRSTSGPAWSHSQQQPPEKARTAPDARTNRPGAFGAGGAGPPPYGRDAAAAAGAAGGNRRSAKERAARKAARVADKAAEASRSSQGCCYGCGAPLQTEVPRGAGYVAPEKYAVKKHHKQLDKVLCQRCSELCNGAMIPGVQDFTQKLQLRQAMAEAAAAAGASMPPAIAAAATGTASSAAVSTAPGATAAAVTAPGGGGAPAAAGSPEGTGTGPEALNLLGKVLATPEQLRSQLTQLSLRAAVVVLLVDLTDASGTLMARVRDMVGRNPIILVGTKMDLMPQGCRPRDVAEWLSGAAAAKKLNVVSVHLVSSHTGEGMSAAVARICSERRSRDVYVVGAANVGKSAFVRAMLKEMAKTEPAAIGTGKYLPVESAMPGTTLGLIPLQAFSSGGILFDTPGVHLHHRIPHMLSPPELKLLHPRRRLTGVVPPLPTEVTASAEHSDSEYDEYGNAESHGKGAAAAGATSSRAAVGGGGGEGEPGAVRKGLGGLKIVDHTPTDEYGMPITGLDAGVRRARASREAAAIAAGARGAAAVAPSQEQQQQQQQQGVRATYVWSDLVRVDVLSGPPETALVFYGPSSMRVVGLPYIRSDQKLEVDYGDDGSANSNNNSSSSSSGGAGRVLVCTDSVAARGGLYPQELVVRANGASGGSAVADVAISGLPGWVAVWAPRAKKDVRLRVWAPRGVEVMLRPSLPCPAPPALLRAWRGEGSREREFEDEAEGGEALNEWSRALAAGGTGDPTSDPQWWEAMAALKDEDLPGYEVAAARRSARRSRLLAAGGAAAAAAAAAAATAGRRTAAAHDDGEDDDDLPDWDDEAELLEGDDEDGDEDEDDEGEAVVVSATVEDILRRPRLDVLAQMDLEAFDEDEDDDEGQGVGGLEGDDDDEEDGVAGFTFVRRADRGRRLDGPSVDGLWDPLAGTAAAPSGPSTAAATRLGMGAGGVRRAASMPRRTAGMGKKSDLEEAEAAEEEWDEAEVVETPEAPSRGHRSGIARGYGSARLRLRRRGLSQAAPEEGDGEVQGEVM